jgi:hypothetical protein
MSKLADIQRTLKADPKKTGFLSVLLVVLLVMVGRLVLSGGAAPQPAGAAAAMTQRPNSNVSISVSQTTSAQNRTIRAAMQKWAEAPVPQVSRNLFAVRIEYFPVDGSRTSSLPQAGDGFWQRLEKSMAVQADQRDKRENMIANFKDEAAKLRLESTMMGPEPKAMVNGELVGEGNVVANFRVVSIETRRIIVEREGIRLEIQMR